YVESAVKQFNKQVKGAEKFWTEFGAEAMLQLRADHLSADDPMAKFWKAREERLGKPTTACPHSLQVVSCTPVIRVRNVPQLIQINRGDRNDGTRQQHDIRGEKPQRAVARPV
ncbi:MAG: hypothetical protein EXS16_21505, partial [Gemmataceae bacterium]|nr:hypothetical protein [Gemmataceae bacterium]